MISAEIEKLPRFRGGKLLSTGFFLPLSSFAKTRALQKSAGNYEIHGQLFQPKFRQGPANKTSRRSSFLHGGVP